MSIRVYVYICAYPCIYIYILDSTVFILKFIITFTFFMTQELGQLLNSWSICHMAWELGFGPQNPYKCWMDIAVSLQFQCSEGGDGIPWAIWLARLSALAISGFSWSSLFPHWIMGRKIRKDTWCQLQVSTCTGTQVHLYTRHMCPQELHIHTLGCASHTCREGERKILDFYRYPQSNYGIVIMGKFVLLGIVFKSQSTYNIQLQRAPKSLVECVRKNKVIFVILTRILKRKCYLI